MKLALPLVIPNHCSRPKINIWSFIGISRQTREKYFNLYHNKHHVIAAVRLGNCDGFGSKLSTLSKSEVLNGVFFEGKHRFLSRRHETISKVMKKSQLGSIETCIHTPNEKLNNFLQIWNLQGNIQFEGLEAQTKLIKNHATAIIVILDDDEDLETMNDKVVNIFGEQQKILVLIRQKRTDDDLSDSDNDDYNSQQLFSPNFDVIKFDPENLADLYERARSLISNYCSQEETFTLEVLERDDAMESLFDIDVKESILETPIHKVKRMLSKINLHYREASDVESLQKCFPLYYSKSSIDGSKKIVEHIEDLDKTKVQFFREHQRGEFDMEHQIDENINKLRQQQSRIAHESTLAVQYMDDIKDLKSRDSLEIQNEKIRLYHKALAFRLAGFNKDGVDIIGFQRELGQRFIALDDAEERRKITQTLKAIVEAGVSIELIDGDTQSLNQDIIVSLLESLR